MRAEESTRMEQDSRKDMEGQPEKYLSSMSTEEFKKMMEELRASNAGQEKYARKQYRMSQITAICSALVLAVVIYACSVILPLVNTTYVNIDHVLSDLTVITSELAETDLQGMIANVDKLVTSSQNDLSIAMDKMNQIDIEGLNKAIQNLSDAVEPLVNFFNRFR